jgi:hypothetical protein
LRTGAPYNLVVTGDLANLKGNGSSTPNNYLRPNLIADPFAAGPVPSNPDPLCRFTISQKDPVTGLSLNGKAADATRTSQTWFNPCAFGVPNNTGAFGSLGRNVFRGPSVYNADLSLFKSFAIREGMKLQLRGEAFNIFNIQNLEAPSVVTINSSGSTIASGLNGTAGRVTALAQGTTPRQLQFGIRFVF